MDYRSAFSETNRRPPQRTSLLSPSLSYGSPISRYPGLSSPIRTTSSPTATAAAMASLSPFSLLSSAPAPLDRTIRLHRRSDPLSVPGPYGEKSSPRLSARVGRKRLPSASVSPSIKERKRFLVFTKVLLKCLRRTKDEQLYHQAKTIIADCIQRNRRKEPGYTPLPAAIERHLRPLVGEAQWKRATAALDLYLEKRRQLRCCAAPVDPLNVFPELCRPQGSKPKAPLAV